MASEEDSKLNLYLGASIKKKWVEYCVKIGKKPGTVIRDVIIERLTTSDQVSLPVFTQQSNTPDSSPKNRVEIRLTSTEKTSIEELAAIENCSLQQWIVNVIRACIAKQPQFGMREIEVLGESNYQLLAIGRNLNQITRNLNNQMQQVTSQQIVELRRFIEQHTTLVSDTLRASLERWSLT